MNQYTHSYPVLLNLIRKYVPTEKDSSLRVHLYLYDITDNIDYYILYENLDEFKTIFALVDPLWADNVLELSDVYLKNLEGHQIYYKVYSLRNCPQWQSIRDELLPLKYGIPQSK